MNMRKMKCIYRFLDENRNVLYVGKTNDLDNRLNVHRNTPTGNVEKYKLTKFIEFIEFETDLELDLMERYFISSLNPKYNIINKEFQMGEISKFEKLVWKPYDRIIDLYKKTKKEIELDLLNQKDRIHTVDLNLFEVLFNLTLKSIIIDFEECSNLDNCMESYFNTLEEMENKSQIDNKLTKYFKELYPSLNVNYAFIEGFLDNEYPLDIYRNNSIKEVVFDVGVFIEEDKTICTKIKVIK